MTRRRELTPDVLDARALARSRVRHRRRRQSTIHRKTTKASLALLGVVWLVLFAQLALGHDPALSRKRAVLVAAAPPPRRHAAHHHRHVQRTSGVSTSADSLAAQATSQAQGDLSQVHRLRSAHSTPAVPSYTPPPPVDTPPPPVDTAPAPDPAPAPAPSPPPAPAPVATRQS